MFLERLTPIFLESDRDVVQLQLQAARARERERRERLVRRRAPAGQPHHRRAHQAGAGERCAEERTNAVELIPPDRGADPGGHRFCSHSAAVAVPQKCAGGVRRGPREGQQRPGRLHAADIEAGQQLGSTNFQFESQN